MEYRIPKKGEIYRHFKGNLYEIIIIARDSETLEEKVVYKEVDGDAAYVRPLPMFVSLVDKEKYPNATQEFRFELVQGVKRHSDKQMILQAAMQSSLQSDAFADAERNNCEASIADHGMIMEYLDLDTVSDKIEYLLRVKDQITEEFIEVVAQSLEFTENAGSLVERYEAILRYLRTVARYESGRLR
ncbi:MAG: DUF1653 domain-containing protein [Tyzzerella sp.]|nr:DUF1653 domain-containing protein [Tyzzerella sp.]